MNITSIIDSFEKNQKHIDEQLQYLRKLLSKENTLNNYKKIDQSLFTNDKVINFFADNLQLSDSDADVRFCELEDILKIYELLVKYYPDNIQYQEDLIAFVYNVMDDENKAKQLITEAMNRIDSKRNYFKTILSEIK